MDRRMMTFEDEAPPPAAADWMVTFGDMMGLLLTFFIMLASMSEMKSPEKYEAMAISMRKQFGNEGGESAPGVGWIKPRHPALATITTTGREQKLTSLGVAAPVRVMTESPVHVSNKSPDGRQLLGQPILFASADATLTDEGCEQLRVIAAELIGTTRKIELRGHETASLVEEEKEPIITDDNWQLSFQRCQAAMNFLVTELKIDPRRIRLSLAGPYEPAQFGTDPNKIRQNERVDIYLLDELTPDLSRPHSSSAARVPRRGRI